MRKSSAALLWFAMAASLFCAAPLRALDNTRPLRHLGHQSWQTDSGLPQNTVHSILQTRDGFLWVATEGGLLRYDGAEFTTFDTRTLPALRSNLILALAEAPDGRLLAGTAQGLLAVANGHARLYTAADGLPGEAVERLYCSARGCSVLTAEGLAFLPAAANTLAPVKLPAAPAVPGSGNPPLALRALDGSLWLATAQELLQVAEGRVLATVPLPAPALALANAPDGSLWIACRGSLLHRRNGQLTMQPLPAAMSPTALLATADGALYLGTTHGFGQIKGAHFLPLAGETGRVRAFYPDRDGAIWISRDAGLARFFGSKLESFTPASVPALSSSPVLSFTEDREGNLWVGTDGSGLTVLRQQKFTTYTTADGLPANSIRSLAADDAGTLWIGSDGGGLTQLRNDSFAPALTTAHGLSSNTVLSLATAGQDSLWIGTPDGLDHLQHGTVKALTSADGLPDDLIRSLLTNNVTATATNAQSTDDLWIGTRRGLAHWQNNRVTETVDRAAGLASDVVGALVPAAPAGSANSLWIATLGGLSHLEGSRVSTLSTRDGLSSNTVTALLRDDDGALWIGTRDSGLNLLRDGRITRFAPQDTGLPASIFSIVPDTRGSLWFGTPSGIARAPRADLLRWAADYNATIGVSNYGVADGMSISECSTGHPAAVRTPDGALWFATLKGISTVNPERSAENTLPPPVALEEATVDEQPVTPASAPFEVKPGHTRFTFRYAGLSFVAPSKVRYRYRLEGFDRNWIDAGTRRTAYYTNLAPGRYTFRVLAANNDGVWNTTGASVPFRVLPHYYQTWWFRTLLLLLAAAIAFELYRLRVRQVESGFQAVLGERTRIAREIHDTLAQDIVGISVQLELVSRLLSTSTDAARTHLEEARRQVKNSLTAARSSIWKLRSPDVDAVDDLPSRLSRAAREIIGKDGPALNFQVHGTYRPAPRAAEDQLFRIASEALRNTVRHAAATKADLLLDYSTAGLELTVADNGRGFAGDDPAYAASGHFGLKGMRERAAEVGAQLSLATAPGSGTRISVRLEIP